MTGIEIERMLSLFDDHEQDGIIRYVTENRQKILDELEREGRSAIPAGWGEEIILTVRK